MSVSIIPLPKSVRSGEGSIPIPAYVTAPAELREAAVTLCELALRLQGVTVSLADETSAPAIVFCRDTALERDHYRLSVEEAGVTVTAADSASACKGAVSLIQLMEEGSLPLISIEDAPDCMWSSFSLDLSRRFHPFHWLLKYVDLCCLCKIRVLHLHFSDDQGYRLPSRVFSELPAQGAHYSFEEMEALVSYAETRGVTLMPEIDVPGHCTPFCTSYPEVFGGGLLIDLSEPALSALCALLDEVARMFPASPYLHIGGDEAAIDAWCDQPHCIAYAEAHIEGFDRSLPDRRYASEQMLACFVNHLANHVFSIARQPVAWEGFGACVNHLVRKDLLLYSWENFYQTTPELLKGGFRIINGSWNPCYVVTPGAVWPVKEVFDWSICRFIPVHPESPYHGTCLEVDPDPAIVGGALLAWGDLLPKKYDSDEEASAAEWSLVRRRLPAIGEHTWDVARKRSWEEYAQADERLQKLIERLEP